MKTEPAESAARGIVSDFILRSLLDSESDGDVCPGALSTLVYIQTPRLLSPAEN